MQRYFSTYKEYLDFFNESESDLLCFAWFDAPYTGLPVDIYIDDSKSYEMWDHQLWLYFRNSYDNTVHDFLPVTISDDPIIPIDEFPLNISDEDFYAIKRFILIHKSAMNMLVNREMFLGEFATIIKYSKQDYRIAESSSSPVHEMSLYLKEESGLPADIWIDQGTHPQHGPRIKFRASKEQKNQHGFSTITISKNPKVLFYPKNSGLSKDDVDILMNFVKNNVDMLLKMNHAKDSNEYYELRKKLVLKKSGV